jgi:hypothetical protein
VAAQADTVRAVSIANPAALDVVGRLSIPGGIRDIASFGNYVCVLDGEALEIVDASNPSKMRIVGKYLGYPSASNIVCVKKFAILSARPYATQPTEVIDISDPTNPVKVNSLLNSVMMGQYAVQAFGSGFSISTITDDGYTGGVVSYQPTQGTFGAQGVAIKGTNAFVVGAEKQPCCLDAFGPFLLKFDIPTGQLVQTVQQGALDYYSGLSLFVADDYIVELNFNNSVMQFLDVNTLQSRLTPSGIGSATFAFSSNVFYFANGRSGLQVGQFADALPDLSNVGGVALPDATAVAVGPNNVFVGAGTNGLYALTQYQPLVRLETAMNTNHTPLVRVLAPIGSSGRIQRASTLKTDSFQDWQYVQLNSYPQIITDTNSRSAFYRFVSP